MEFRCPKHDVVFQTETDHTRPGSRVVNSEGKETGDHRHPLYGGVAGHVDCPLCKRAIKERNPEINNLPEPTTLVPGGTGGAGD